MIPGSSHGGLHTTFFVVPVPAVSLGPREDQFEHELMLERGRAIRPRVRALAKKSGAPRRIAEPGAGDGRESRTQR